MTCRGYLSIGLISVAAAVLTACAATLPQLESQSAQGVVAAPDSTKKDVVAPPASAGVTPPVSGPYSSTTGGGRDLPPPSPVEKQAPKVAVAGDRIAGIRGASIVLFSSAGGADGRRVAANELDLPMTVRARTPNGRYEIMTIDGPRWVAGADLVFAQRPSLPPDPGKH